MEFFNHKRTVTYFEQPLLLYRAVLGHICIPHKDNTALRDGQCMYLHTA